MELVEAQDYILGVLGSAPTGDITSQNPDAQAARARLDHVKSIIQKHGWWFNTDYSITMAPSIDDKEILLPVNVLKVVPLYTAGVVQRGIKLYDSVNATYQFEADVVVNRIVDLDWDLLPASVQDYVMYRAAGELCATDLEDSVKANEQYELAITAKQEIKREHLQIQKQNVFTSPRVARAQAGVRPRGGNRILFTN